MLSATDVARKFIGSLSGCVWTVDVDNAAGGVLFRNRFYISLEL